MNNDHPHGRRTTAAAAVYFRRALLLITPLTMRRSKLISGSPSAHWNKMPRRKNTSSAPSSFRPATPRRRSFTQDGSTGIRGGPRLIAYFEQAMAQNRDYLERRATALMQRARGPARLRISRRAGARHAEHFPGATRSLCVTSTWRRLRGAGNARSFAESVAGLSSAAPPPLPGAFKQRGRRFKLVALCRSGYNNIAACYEALAEWDEAIAAATEAEIRLETGLSVGPE